MLVYYIYIGLFFYIINNLLCRFSIGINKTIHYVEPTKFYYSNSYHVYASSIYLNKNYKKINFFIKYNAQKTQSFKQHIDINEDIEPYPGT